MATGAATRAVELLPKPKHNGQEEQTKEEDVVDEDLKAPVELLMKFLRALMDKEFEVASKLCEMILIYEPDNPEASEFLPLIQRKLLEEQESERSDEEDKGEDGDSEKSSSNSSSSCSSSSSDDDNDEEEDDDDGEKHMNRHKPCPPSHISP
ncbi:glutamate-rich protein 2 [Leuresthes tenuis]|uniref:glutamate-rich protein 2 n=1 Tax=Leuresthes tenuis TaxID=355514 RepID=UPI003B5114D5